MQRSQLVSSVFVGLLAGLMGIVVLSVVTAMRAILRLGQDATPIARTAQKKPASAYARPGTDAALVVKMPEGRRRRDGGFEESRPAA